MLPRTPIIIRLVDPVIQENENTDVKWDDFYLNIKSPSTSYDSYIQSFVQEKRVNIPKDGVLKLKLIPSYSYVRQYSTGRSGLYEVELYTEYSSLPKDIWHWEVPYVNRKTVDILTYYNPGIRLPDNLYEIVNIDRENYEIKKGLLVIDNAEDGEQVRVEYKVGLTLNEITTDKYGSVSTDKRQSSYRPFRYWF